MTAAWTHTGGSLGGFLQGFLEKIWRVVDRQPSLPALANTETPDQVSYGQLRQEAEHWCGFVKSLNLTDGEKVLLILPPGPDFVTALLGAIGAGAIVIPMNSSLTLYEFEQIARLSKAVGIITNKAVADSCYPALVSNSHIRFAIITDGPVATISARSNLTLVRFDRDAAPATALTEPTPEQTITLHYTYKGLGYPLGVAHSYAAYSGVLEWSDELFPFEPGTKHFLGLPIYPVYGLVLCVLSPLTQGATLLFGTKKARLNLVDTLAKHQVGVACIVPEVMKHMAQTILEGNATSAPTSRHKTLLVSGGSYLPPQLAQLLESRLNVEVQQGYGTTETLPCVITRGSEVGTGSIGRALGQVEVRIANATGQDLPNGRVGELWLRGPSIIREFDLAPSETSQFFHDGWFRTGDLVSKDDQGQVYFVGRRLPFTKVASQMVDLIEVEQIALRHPAVAKARSVVEQDDMGTVSVTLYIQAKTHRTTTDTELLRFCRAYLSPHKIPKHISIYRSAPLVVSKL